MRPPHTVYGSAARRKTHNPIYLICSQRVRVTHFQFDTAMRDIAKTKIYTARLADAGCNERLNFRGMYARYVRFIIYFIYLN